jgi:hypothetical protein
MAIKSSIISVLFINLTVLDSGLAPFAFDFAVGEPEPANLDLTGLALSYIIYEDSIGNLHMMAYLF